MSNFFSYIIQGTAITIGVTLVALPFGFILGLLMALVHTYRKFLNPIAAAHSLLMHSMSPIVLFFILYFILFINMINPKLKDSATDCTDKHGG